MASTSGCVRFEKVGGLYLLSDNKVSDVALSSVATRGTLGVYPEHEFKERVDNMGITLQPIDFFMGQEEVANPFTDTELLALGIYGRLGRLVLPDDGEVIAYSDLRDMSSELRSDMAALDWQLTRDPGMYNTRRIMHGLQPAAAA